MFCCSKFYPQVIYGGLEVMTWSQAEQHCFAQQLDQRVSEGVAGHPDLRCFFNVTVSHSASGQSFGSSQFKNLLV